jgi:hypothetical protein
MSIQHNSLLGRRCAWCGSDNVRFVQRGLAGPTDEMDQYVSCNACGRVTYEFVTRSTRDLRFGRYVPGGIFRDPVHQTRYEILRVLKIGAREHLVYLKPLPLLEPSSRASVDGSDDPGAPE